MSAALLSVLTRYPASARPRFEPIPLGNAGGLSGSQLWRFDTGRGMLVARMWPIELSERPRIEQIHRWIARADRLRFVPQPIQAQDGRTVLEENGRLWEVVPWMLGKREIAEPPRPTRVKAAFSAVAEFHKAMGEITPRALSPGLLARTAEIEALLASNLIAWRSLVTRTPADEARGLALLWLDFAGRIAPSLLPDIREAARKPVSIQPVLRDARPEHFLFEEDRVTGLVDFGAMGLDMVSIDLARLMGEWFKVEDKNSRELAISAYGQVRPLTADERLRIAVFEKSGDLLRGARWLQWHYVDHRRFEDPKAVIQGLGRSVTRLSQAKSSQA
jgi:Ser/Thr protein kinase RdoA (MazF antagonist)